MADEAPPAIELSYGREKESRGRRRFRKLFRWFWRGVLVLVVVAVLAHTAWLLWATHRLNKAIDALKSAGEPTSATDLQPVVPPAELNAQTDLAAAGVLLSKQTVAGDRLEALEDSIRAPLIPLERARLRAYVDEYKAVPPLLESAAAKPFNVITTPMTSPLLHVMLTPIGGLRDTANCAGYYAEFEHDAGRDDLACRRLREIESIAHAAGGNPMLVGYLVAVALRELEISHALAIAPTLGIGTRTGEASPADVRQWIAELEDMKTIDSEMYANFQGERVMQIEMMAMVDSGAISFQQMTGGASSARAAKPWFPLRYLLRPLVRWSAANSIESATGVLNSFGAANWPAMQAKLRPITARLASLNLLNAVERLFMARLPQMIETRYRLQVDRSLAAVALASRLCEVETGHLPMSWLDLVPKYLPAIPLDGMASGETLKARFGGEDPIVWSVGKNGVDDGGNDLMSSNSTWEWNCRDRVLHLIPRPRTISAAEQVTITLNMDAPIRKAPAASTQPSTQPVQPDFQPDWDSLADFDVAGDAGQFPGLETRRDVFRALMMLPGDDSVQPATVPSREAHLHGWARIGPDVWKFDIRNDGTMVLTTPAGDQRRQAWRASPASSDGPGPLR